MARAGTCYPQVEPGAAGLMDSRVTACPARATVSQALALARRRGAEVLVTGRGAAVRRRDLERAALWGLGRSPISELALGGIPSVEVASPEIGVRRLLQGGAPLVLVRSGRGIAGVVDR
ncbi:MAG TPA: hypothetical protein VFN71_01125, partial [Methylomirabilota bacterium]|nr:hypothetical protein [Methylomirabilota bacterium]